MANDSLKSVMDTIVNFKNKHFSFKRPNGSYLDRSSISKATKDIIASFPVICSDTISPPVASMVAKATERNCVVMLQLLFSSAYLKGASGREVLSKWHTNMDNDMNMDDLLDIMNTFSENAKMLTDREYNEIIREMSGIIQENIRSANDVYPISSFSESSINNYIVTENYKGDTRVILSEAKDKDKKTYDKQYFPPEDIIITPEEEYNQHFKMGEGPEYDYNKISSSLYYSYEAKDTLEKLCDELHDIDPNATPEQIKDAVSAAKALIDANSDLFKMDHIISNDKAEAEKFNFEKNIAIAQLKHQKENDNLKANQQDRSLDQRDKEIENAEQFKKEEFKLRKAEINQKAADSALSYLLKRTEQLDRKEEFEKNYKLNNDMFDYRKTHDKDLLDLEKKKQKHQKKKDKKQHKMEKEKFKWEKEKARKSDEREEYRQLQADMRDTTDFFHKQLLSTDVKKYNELVPSLLVVRFQAVDPDDDNINNYRVDSQCIIGVKTRLIPVDSFDIINHMRSIEKTRLSLVNLVRATTKEISFCKDFIGAIDQAKIDAKQNSRLSKSSPIWRVLQNRANTSTMNRLRKRRANDAGAICTLVVSIEEVNALKKEYDIDLTNPAKAKSMMEAYNLLSFVIVDEQVEVVRFLYDGEKFFQDYAFSMLERETGDNSYKKVVNLISKLNRG